MKLSFLVLLLLLLLVSGFLQADEIETGRASTPEGATPDLLRLKDGTVLRGRLVQEDDEGIVFVTEDLGHLEISRDRILRLVVHGRGDLVDPDRNTIMFCPTPQTLPRGQAYFRNFELFFLNYGVGLTDQVNLSLGTLFPVTEDAFMLSGGLKVRLLDREEHAVGLALTGNYTFFEDYRFGALGAVAGVGNDRRSLNFFINRAFDEDGDAETVYFLGADFQGVGNSKLLLEFFSNSPVIGDWDDDLNGFLNVGVRWFGESYSFSLTGFRPLWEDDGSSFFAFPMVMFSQHF